ncbi:MAG: 2-phospho-L-lactate transferase [Candidatus Lokiarchaeota archaeon]|nr:2-phospho-L-lactate transferase [Candidatus Lokiarchaeota archaeon]
MIVVLAGGVGAARFLSGLVQIMDPKDLFIVVNTGDDIEFFGLKISPDLDIIMYTLANIVNERGWGRNDESFNFLSALKDYDYELWFNLGDKDLATHVIRTDLMNQGKNLAEITQILSDRLKIKSIIIPMTNHPVPTMIQVPGKIMHFEEYMIKRGATDPVKKIIYKDIEKAIPTEGVIDAIEKSEGIIICPSNPLVSINTILSIKGIKEAILNNNKKVIAISPIIGSNPVKGPLDKLMRGLGMEVSAFSIANYYKNLISAFIIDIQDESQKEKIEKLGIEVFITDTLMKNMEIKKTLAEIALKYIRSS